MNTPDTPQPSDPVEEALHLISQALDRQMTLMMSAGQATDFEYVRDLKQNLWCVWAWTNGFRSALVTPWRHHG